MALEQKKTQPARNAPLRQSFPADTQLRLHLLQQHSHQTTYRRRVDALSTTRREKVTTGFVPSRDAAIILHAVTPHDILGSSPGIIHDTPLLDLAEHLYRSGRCFFFLFFVFLFSCL